MAGEAENPKKYISPYQNPETSISIQRCATGVSRQRSSRDLAFHICATSNVPVHLHENFYEIFIVTSGKLTHYFGSEPTVMKVGDACLLCPGQRHKLSTYKTYTSQHINLTCSETMAKVIFGSPDNAQLTFQQQSLHLTEVELQIVRSFQESVFLSSDEQYQDATIGVLMAYVARLFLLRSQLSPETDQIPKWLSVFLEQLHQLDFSAPLSLPDLYVMSGKPQSTLSRQFKKYMGQTLVCYLGDLKLTRASNLLKNSTFSLPEIATASGFDSYPHFSRLFKKKYGLSPHQYRSTHSFYPFPKNTDSQK